MTDMTVDAASYYRLSKPQFDNLFTDNIRTDTMESLAQSAANGNLDSIDLLHNLALRKDTVGEQAENVLFDLFSGKITGKIGVDRDIQQASLKLYQIAFKNEDYKIRFSSPTRLLYMAGSAMSELAQKQALSRLFVGDQQAQVPHEQTGELDWWSPARMLTTDEISAAMNKMPHPDCSLNFPSALVDPVNSSNILGDLIAEKIRSTYLGFLDKPEFFPINTGDHWVLFVLHRDQSDSGAVKAVVFSSASNLTPETKAKLNQAAAIASGDGNSVTFVEEHIQKHVPNGCGIFVIWMMEQIIAHPECDPGAAAEKFADEFMRKSPEEQTNFNIQFRRQLHERCFPPPASPVCHTAPLYA
ncbi:MAG: ElaD/SseL family deubiquitinase [Enterobacterales bacterium]|uniref:ElaD/SseL family deubiquitinase n=1 Tax=Serratia sp. (in: enterobacteria) TaxID=616 RepID=UPI003F38993B